MTTPQIGASVASVLSQQELDTTRISTSTLGTSAQVTIRPGQFVFFAAFDGTNNDRTNIALSGTPQGTNVAQLESQLAAGNAANGDFQSRYYAGPGTGDISGGFDARSTNPTPYLTATAKKALTEFAIEAKAWLDADPTRSAGDINAAMTGFSRGAGIRSNYRSQLENERIDTLTQLNRSSQEFDKSTIKSGLLEIKAPNDGIVKDLAVTTKGAVVQAGALLLNVVPKEEPVQAEVLLSNEDVGFIAVGQKTQVKVALVGADSSDPKQQQQTQQPQLTYRALVTLDSQSLKSPDGSKLALSPGMLVSAEIHQGRRTVLEYLLSPVQKVGAEAARER